MPSVFAQCIITKQMSWKTFRILNSVFWLSILKIRGYVHTTVNIHVEMAPLGFWKKSVCGDVWDDLVRQEVRTDDHAWWSGLPLRNSSPGVLSQTFTEGLCVLQSHSCGPAWGSWGLVQDFAEINLEKEVSELCSTWIACNREVLWACLQCHPVGTGQALLVLLEVPHGKLLSLPWFSGVLLMQ